MPVLFLAIMAADTEAVRRLLLCEARTDTPLPREVETDFTVLLMSRDKLSNILELRQK